jgi:hypothetical protein
MSAARHPDLRRALSVLPERFDRAVHTASKMLTEAGVAHALVGGLGASSYANEPWSTQDVDFLVADDQFVEHAGGVVTLRVPVVEVAGVSVDSVPRPPEAPGVIESLARATLSDGVPLAPVEAIVLLKLVAGRPRDHAAIIALLESGADLELLRAYVARHAPVYSDDLDTLVRVCDGDESNIQALKRRLLRP